MYRRIERAAPLAKRRDVVCGSSARHVRRPIPWAVRLAVRRRLPVAGMRRPLPLLRRPPPLMLLVLLLAALLLLSPLLLRRLSGRPVGRYPNVRVICTHSSEGGYSGKEGYVELKACSF